MTTHDKKRYVNLDEAMEKVKYLRDPMYELNGFERPGWVAAISWALSALDKLPKVEGKP